MNNETRINLFKMARDIPYKIALMPEEQDYCCATKPKILDLLLFTEGLKTRHILCTFRWSDLALPSDVLLKSVNEEDTHEFLEVFIPETGKWVAVDPSWDAALAGAGLRVADWDGFSPTTICVDPIQIFSPEESADLIAQEDNVSPEIRAAYLAENAEFFRALNNWMASVRNI